LTKIQTAIWCTVLWS